MPGKTSQTSKDSVVQVNFTTGGIVKAVAIIVAVALLYFLIDIVAILLLAVLLAALIDPFATRLQKAHIPRGIAVAIVYVVIILLAVAAGLLVIPPMLEQLFEVLRVYSPHIEQLTGGSVDISIILSGELTVQEDIASLVETVRQAGFADALPQVVDIISDVFGGLISFFVVFILAFYMVVEEKIMRKGVDWATPEKYQKFVLTTLPELRKKIGSWLRGQLLLMFLIFLLTYVALLILGMPYALVLALVAGLLEIVPFLGPTLSAIPAAIIGFSVSPVHGFFVLVIYFLIQQFEGDFLTPKVMQKAVGLNPIVSIVSILIGFELAGILGAVLAIPFAMVTGVCVNEWARYKKQKEQKE